MKGLRHGSLFSGIGGFELAAEAMGWDNVFSVEFDPFCSHILQHHFPETDHFNDIYDFNAEPYRGQIDILSGGFPCQPFSSAGQKRGTSDNRYLWPEMLRVIREVGPTYVVAENVRGLVSWSDGMVFDTVCADLEGAGYEVLPCLLPAAGIGAPHKRDRVWFVAYANSVRMEHSAESGSVGQDQGEARRQTTCPAQADGVSQYASDTDDKRLQGRKVTGSTGQSGKKPHQQPARRIRTEWENFPTVPPLCGGDDGLSKELDGITFPKWRKLSIKAYGNAIVPEVALQIFKAIESLR